MSDLVYLLSILALIGLLALEGRMHAEERRRLTAAALAPSPQAAVQAVAPESPKDARKPDQRPIPLGL